MTVEGEEFWAIARQVVEQYQLIEERFVEKKSVKKKFGVSNPTLYLCSERPLCLRW